jgi:hypothetical protein
MSKINAPPLSHLLILISSEAYDVFAKALADSYAAIAAIDRALLVQDGDDCQDYYRSRPAQESARRYRDSARTPAEASSSASNFFNQSRVQKGKAETLQSNMTHD